MSDPAPPLSSSHARALASEFVQASGYRTQVRYHRRAALVASVLVVAAVACIVVAPQVVPSLRTGDLRVEAAVGGGLVLIATVLGNALMRTRLGLRSWAWLLAPALVAGMLLGSGEWPSIAAACAVCAAAVSAALVVGLVRVSFGVVILTVLCCMLWGATETIGATSMALAGMDAPHPPLWVLVPVSQVSYIGMLINWLALLWASLAGAAAAAYRLGASPSALAFVGAPAITVAAAAWLPAWACAATATVVMLGSGRRLLQLDPLGSTGV